MNDRFSIFIYFLSPHADIKKTLENTGFPRVLMFF